MSSPIELAIDVGSGAQRRSIAVQHRAGRSPGLFWLGGFKSAMSGAKATALDAMGAAAGLAVTRFDYSGHGVSGGRFEDGTISRWLEEAAAIYDTTEGPQIVVGSSMGGWLALLLARRQVQRGAPFRGLVLIAPAVDMTSTLMPACMTAAQQAQLAAQGYYQRDSAYGDGPYTIGRALLEDGATHSLFGSVIETGCPVHILQGGRDTDVPPSHAQKLVSHILHDPVTFTLIPDGDHRLSRNEDLEVLRRAVMEMV